jgi:hypothetical protein
VRNVNTKREVAGALGGPVDWDESLREGWVRGVVVHLDDVDLRVSGCRLNSEGEELRVGRGTVETDRTEGGSVTLEWLADVPRLGKELHVAADATSRVRGDANEAGPALVVVGNVVDDLVVLHGALVKSRQKNVGAHTSSCSPRSKILRGATAFFASNTSQWYTALVLTSASVVWLTHRQNWMSS